MIVSVAVTSENSMFVEYAETKAQDITENKQRSDHGQSDDYPSIVAPDNHVNLSIPTSICSVKSNFRCSRVWICA